MSLENITKEEWDENFKHAITTTEKYLKSYTQMYINLLNMRGEYRKDYKTHRVIHQADFKKGLLTYKKGVKRNIGYNRSNDKT